MTTGLFIAVKYFLRYPTDLWSTYPTQEAEIFGDQQWRVT